jgi:hypothetical protein
MFREIVIVLAALAVFTRGLRERGCRCLRAYGLGWPRRWGRGRYSPDTHARSASCLQRSERDRTRGGHWGAYYGPMIVHP